MKSRQVKIARGSSLPFDTPPSSVVTLKKNTCCSSEAVTLQLVCHTNCGITMATCAAASSTRLVVNTSCRVRKTRTLASSQLAFTGSSTQQVRCHSFESRCTVPGGSPTSLFSHSLRSSFAPLPATALAADFCEAQYQGRQTYRELSLSAAALALTLGFAAANSSTSSDNGSSISSSKLSRKGGGSGGGNGDKPLSSVFASREKAEEDVRKVEEDAVQNPYMVSAGAIQGVRWAMEDAYCVENGGRFVAVFDGHGGSDVSSALRECLYNFYRKLLSTKHWEERDDFDHKRTRIPSISSHVAALRGGLEQVEEEVLKHDDLVYQGSTAVAVVLHEGKDGQKTLLSANVGDSRAILSRKGKAIALTRDHKPNDEREKARIRAQGEEVQWDPYGQVYRVRDLSLSRAIGDKFAKPAVSSEAEIMHFPVVEEDDEFILLASDGLWDVMTSQEAVDFVQETLANSSGEHLTVEDSELTVDREQIAKIVANEALERGSADNVCVIVVWLKDQKNEK